MFGLNKLQEATSSKDSKHILTLQITPASFRTIIMSLPLLRFLQIPFDDIDFDNVVLSDPSLTESSNSPRLTASDEMVLDPAYWFSHPPRYRYLMQRISTLLPTLQASALSTEDQNWVAALSVFVYSSQRIFNTV